MRILLVNLLLMLSFWLGAQGIDQTYLRSKSCDPEGIQPSLFSDQYVFKKDGNYRFVSIYQYYIDAMTTMAIGTDETNGTYTRVKDTIYIISDKGVKRKLLVDEVRNRLIDLETLHGFYSLNAWRDTMGICLEINEIVRIADDIDSNYFNLYIPTGSETGKAQISLAVLTEYLQPLSFLKGAFVEEAQGGPNTHSYDPLGRVVFYCARGWFNMSSIPWTVQVKYAKGTNLITKTIHHGRGFYLNSLEKIHEDDGYETYSYHANNDLQQVKFYSADGVLRRTISIHRSN